MDGCLFFLSLCGPVIDWRPVQGVPCHSPNYSWDRLQIKEELPNNEEERSNRRDERIYCGTSAQVLSGKLNALKGKTVENP